MRRLVNDLITLSKMEEQATTDLVFAEVSLSDVAYECVLTFEQVEVRRAGRGATFVTRNHWNHDVDARGLSSLFDRFVRGEKSRDRSGGASSYGLGLSIARAIAQKNDAKLEASEDGEGRIVFCVTFAR